MTDKVQEIIIEIKNRISNYQEYIDSGYDDEEVIKQEELKDLLTSIDSMQEESVSEDLENQSKKYSNSWYCSSLKELNGTGCGCFGVQEAFMAGTEWQKQQDAKILEFVITNGKDYPTLDSFLNTFKMMQYGKIKM